MPALPIIANVFRVAFHWTSAVGLTGLNVLHFRSSVLTIAGLNALLEASWLRDQITCVSSQTNIDQMTITKLDGTSASVVFPTTNIHWTGESGGDPIPQMAMIISLRTALRGRAHRGRVYLPFVGEAQSVNGTLLAANVAFTQTAWNSFVSAMSTGTAPLVVASYVNATAETVTSQIAEGQAATQRRRMSRLR